MKKGTELEYQEFKRLEAEKDAVSKDMIHSINKHMRQTDDYDAAVFRAQEEMTGPFDEYAGKKVDFWERMRSKYSLDPSQDYVMNPQGLIVPVGIAASVGVME